MARFSALNSAPNLTGMTAVAAQSCKCANGSAVNCGGSCGGAMLVYVEVTTHATAPNSFSYPGLSFTGAVAGKAVMRAR